MALPNALVHRIITKVNMIQHGNQAHRIDQRTLWYSKQEEMARGPDCPCGFILQVVVFGRGEEGRSADLSVAAIVR